MMQRPCGSGEAVTTAEADAESDFHDAVEELPEESGSEEDVAPSECVVCLDEPCDTLLVPCGHMCLCATCAETLRQRTGVCPVCMTQTAQYIRL